MASDDASPDTGVAETAPAPSFDWRSRLTARNVTRILALGANVGALLGVIVLIFEVQQNRELMRAQIRHDLATGIVEIIEGAAQNPELAEALRRSRGGEEMTTEQAFQVELYLNGLFRYWENVHYQYRVGLYDDVEFAAQREAWRNSVNQSASSRAYWCNARELYSPEFRAEIDSLLPASACVAP